MSTGEIIFLIAFSLVLLAVAIIIIRQFIWMGRVGRTLKKSTDSIIPRVDNIISGKTNLLKGNILDKTGLLDIAQITKASRLLLDVNIDATCCYYDGQNVAGLSHLKLKYRFLDNSGKSLNGSFLLKDGSNNNIQANINNGVVEFIKNNTKMATVDISKHVILNDSMELIGKITGNFVLPAIIGNAFWSITDNANNINRAYSYQPAWSYVINGLDIKLFENINENQDDNSLIDFFKNLTSEKKVRWPIFPENNPAFASEELKLVSVFLSTLSFVLYMSAYKPN